MIYSNSIENSFIIRSVEQNSLGQQVLAATQTSGEAGKKWFQGTADAVRQFTWVFEVGTESFISLSHVISTRH